MSLFALRLRGKPSGGAKMSVLVAGWGLGGWVL